METGLAFILQQQLNGRFIIFDWGMERIDSMAKPEYSRFSAKKSCEFFLQQTFLPDYFQKWLSFFFCFAFWRRE